MGVFVFVSPKNWNLNFFLKIHPKTIKFEIISRGMTTIRRILSKVIQVKAEKSV